jgi:hypothetical protein
MISYAAIIILNTIALIAILVARSELSKALREIDKLSSSRASDRAIRSASLCANQALASLKKFNPALSDGGL